MKKSTIIILAALGLAACSLPVIYFYNQKNESQDNKPTETKKYVGYQLEKPKNNEEVATIKTNFGDIKIKFFPEEAPKAVENFKTLASKGYYENVTFHRVIEDFMIQSGDPTGTGRGGKSIWGKGFEDEFSGNLFNITGAVSMANSGKNTNGSQFFINFQDPKKFTGWNVYENAYSQYKKNPDSFTRTYGKTIDMSKITDEIKKLYSENGGNPFLDGYYSTTNEGYSVFGQVFEGLETVEKISKLKTDENEKPLEEVKIEKVTLDKYQ